MLVVLHAGSDCFVWGCVVKLNFVVCGGIAVFALMLLWFGFTTWVVPLFTLSFGFDLVVFGLVVGCDFVDV